MTNIKKYFKKLKTQWKVLVLVSLFLPFGIALFRITTGSISFWYDPARDFMLAISQHQKIGLIGQPSGIPGIFYGPYWVWSLSIVLLIFKDPRIIAFIILTLPYFIIFPYTLFKLKRIWGTGISIVLWLFFALSFEGYMIHLWNPHIAPLLTLVVIYLVSKINFKKANWKDLSVPLFSGFIAGLLMNYHISFGLGVLVGLFLYLIIKRSIKVFLSFGTGLTLVFLPFFVFEIRHGFNQINALFVTLTSSSAVVTEKSGGHLDIFKQFIGRFSTLIGVPDSLGMILFGGLSIYLAYGLAKKRIKLSLEEKSLLLIICLISSTTLIIYILTKNPVWDYHFIGVEILFLLFIGIVSAKSSLIKKLMVVLLALVIVSKSQAFITELNSNPFESSSLVTKQFIVDTIYDDSNNDSFSVFIYSPGQFTPDFEYLLKWRKDVLNMHTYKIDQKGDLVYLIIPQTSIDLRDDFIDNRTPNEIYHTAKKWEIEDGTIVLRRELNEKN